MTDSHSCSPAASRLLYFDVTKHSRQSHHSGLKRVSGRLHDALRQVGGLQVHTVRWSVFRQCFLLTESSKPVTDGQPNDIFFTPEVFAFSERPFIRRWLKRFRGPTGRIFYDAIPFFHPEATWPKSVRRFPRMLRDLAVFDNVFYISGQSRKDALRAGIELGVSIPEGSLLTLGSDYREPCRDRDPGSSVTFLQVGILEPRKGQQELLEACEELWQGGFVFKLVLIGRTNPHFGLPLIERISELRSSGRDILHLSDADDEDLATWHSRADLLVSASRAEGFGLPVLEALWAGCPVLASRQPVCDLVKDGNGCIVMESVDKENLKRHLKRFLEQPEELRILRDQIIREGLPRWRDTARQLLEDFPCDT